MENVSIDLVIVITVFSAMIVFLVDRCKRLSNAINKVTVLGGLSKLTFIESGQSYTRNAYAGSKINEALCAFDNILSEEQSHKALGEGMDMVSYYLTAEGSNDDNAPKFLKDIELARKELGL